MQPAAPPAWEGAPQGRPAERPTPSGKVAGRIEPTPSGKIAPTPSGKITPTPSGKMAPAPSGKIAATTSGKFAQAPSGTSSAPPAASAPPSPSESTATSARVAVNVAVVGAALREAGTSLATRLAFASKRTLVALGVIVVGCAASVWFLTATPAPPSDVAPRAAPHPAAPVVETAVESPLTVATRTYHAQRETTAGRDALIARARLYLDAKQHQKARADLLAALKRPDIAARKDEVSGLLQRVERERKR